MQSLDYNLYVFCNSGSPKLFIKAKDHQDHFDKSQNPIDIHIKKLRGNFREKCKKLFLLFIIILIHFITVTLFTLQLSIYIHKYNSKNVTRNNIYLHQINCTLTFSILYFAF
jgi:hypothetical protein